MSADPAEALARALHDVNGTFVVAATTWEQEWSASILAHPFTDSERAALVAALLDGHEGVLAEATYRAEMGPRWSPHRMTEAGQRAYREDHARRVVAALAAAEKEPTP